MSNGTILRVPVFLFIHKHIYPLTHRPNSTEYFFMEGTELYRLKTGFRDHIHLIFVLTGSEWYRCPSIIITCHEFCKGKSYLLWQMTMRGYNLLCALSTSLVGNHVLNCRPWLQLQNNQFLGKYSPLFGNYRLLSGNYYLSGQLVTIFFFLFL